MIKHTSILAILAFAMLALSAVSFAQMDMEPATALPQGGVLVPTNDTLAETGGTHLSVSIFPLEAYVPRMSDFNLQATYANGSPMQHVTFDVRLVQTEDKKVVFDTHLHGHDGTAQFSYGFNDGSEHRLEVTATQDKEDNMTQTAAPVHHEYLIDVSPQQPTLALNARTMVLLMSIFAVGALIGRWWGGRQNAKKASHAKA